MTRYGAPPVLTEAERNPLAARLREGDGLFVGVDFDGTLAPIAADPDVPVITPACRRALLAVAGSSTSTVAVVSGRALPDVMGRVGIPGIVYAGNHGLEIQRDGTRDVHPGAEQARPALSGVLDRLESSLATIPGCTIEDKGLTATVHYRRAPRDLVDDVRATVYGAVSATSSELTVSSGKESLEIRPAVDWDKGAAVRQLLESERAGWRALYVGDDETDEDAFRAVQPEGVGILVGSRAGSRADFRLLSQRAVAPFLSWLSTDVLGEPGTRAPGVADGGHPPP